MINNTKLSKENKKLEKQIKKVNSLLRRVYDVIELNHLRDKKLSSYYTGRIFFKKSLGEDIFNYLQSKDQEFKDIVIKRQKRYREKQKIRLLINKQDHKSYTYK